MIVSRDVVPGGAQAVAIEGSAYVATVRERDHGWAVPRLHEARVVLVEVLLGLGEVFVVLPGCCLLFSVSGDRMRMKNEN